VPRSETANDGGDEQGVGGAHRHEHSKQLKIYFILFKLIKFTLKMK
jgi:hypothetical protein